MVSVISFNCRGLNDPNQLSILLKQSIGTLRGLDNVIIQLQETKIEQLTKTHLKILEYYHLTYKISPASKTSGGLISLFSNSLKVKNVYISKNMLATTFEEGIGLYVNVYIHCRDSRLTEFSEDLQNIIFNPSEPRVFCGDFNALASKEDSSNQNTPNNDFRLYKFQKITRILQSFQVTNVTPQYFDDTFTHFDKRSGTHTRIDHFFTSCTDSQLITKYNAFSDHRILILKYKDNDFHRSTTWKLNDNILRYHDVINELIEDTMTMTESDNILDSYDHAKNIMRERLRCLCIHDHRQSKYVEKQLVNQISKCENQISNSGLNEIALKELSSANNKLAQHYLQRSRKDISQIKGFFTDYNHGDSHSVKSYLQQRKTRLKINSIKTSDGIVTTDEEIIVNESYNHYTERFAKPERNDTEQAHFSEMCSRVIDQFKRNNENEIQNNFVQSSEVNDITECEVKEAIKKLNADSAPGPDGLTSKFYKAHASFFVPYLCMIFNLASSNDWVPDSFKKSIIKLIPKKRKPEKAEDYRPISLINTDQKILSHILANRVKTPFGGVIKSHQNAYLENRQIHNSLLQVNLNLENLGDDDCLVALDFSKAFDRIDREFIFSLLRTIGIWH